MSSVMFVNFMYEKVVLFDDSFMFSWVSEVRHMSASSITVKLMEISYLVSIQVS